MNDAVSLSTLALLPYGAMILDHADVIVGLNPAGEKILNCPAERLVGHHLSDVLPLPRTFPRHVPFELEVTQSNEGLFLQLHLTPFDQGYLLTLQDVSPYQTTINELTRQKQMLRDLVTFTRSTTEGTNMYKVLQNAVKGASHLTNAEAGSLILVDSDQLLAQSILVHNDEVMAENPKFLRKALSQGLVRWVIEHRQPVVIHDTLQDERWLAEGPFSARSVLSTPILYQGTVLGALTLMHSDCQQFSGEQLGLLQAAADQISAVLHNALLYESERQLATARDKLYKFLKTVGQSLHLDEMAERAVELLTELTGWPKIEIYVPEQDENELKLLADRSLSKSKSFTLLSTSKNLALRALKTGKIQTIPHDIAPGTLYSNYQALAIPLTIGGQLCGILSTATYSGIPFDENEIQLAKAMSEALALALRNAQLFESVQDRDFDWALAPAGY